MELTALPVRESLERACAGGRAEAEELAATGGEDYKLLFTVAPEGWDALAADYRTRFGAELYAVGRIIGAETSGSDGNKIVWTENGTPVERDWRGFVHF